MRLNDIQHLERLNKDRVDAGHSSIDIDVIGERTSSSVDVIACCCGAACVMSSVACEGQVTAMLPHAMAILHACELHMGQIVGGPPTPSCRSNSTGGR